MLGWGAMRLGLAGRLAWVALWGFQWQDSWVSRHWKGGRLESTQGKYMRWRRIGGVVAEMQRVMWWKNELGPFQTCKGKIQSLPYLRWARGRCECQRKWKARDSILWEITLPHFFRNHGVTKRTFSKVWRGGHDRAEWASVRHVKRRWGIMIPRGA